MKLIIALLVSATALPVFAGQVKGYVRKDGTYVAPHMRSNPNSTKLDNYGTQGNVNPYTGRQGSANPYPNPYNVQPSQPPLYTPQPRY